jgi:DNA-binding PadR family transcriptional regulator
MVGNGKNQGKTMKDNEKFTRREVEKVIYSTLDMMVKDSNYFYSSTVDHRYSRLTTNGEEFLIKIMNKFLPLLCEVEQDELDQRAKNVVFDTLAKEDEQ